MSNINPSNPPQVLTSGPAPTHSPDMMAFTHPHPVDQQEIQFDISRRRKGVCKFFNSQKGFGFINDDHPEELGNQEVFVHYTSIESKGNFRSLAEGEEVEYVVAPGQKGFQATEVTGPAGRAVQGDVKSKMPKTPTFVPYPMGIMPAAGAYALAGPGSPYMQPDPYMTAGAYPAPYPGQVFYIPSPMGVIAGGHSPNLTAMSPYAGATSPHPSTRSPTVPFTHHQHGQVAMALSPQPAAGGFGFGSPSMAYGFGGSSQSAGLPGASPGAGSGVGEMRSPRIVGAGGGGSRGFVGSSNFGAEQIHPRAGPVGSAGGQNQLRGFSNGGGSSGSLLYTTGSGIPPNHH
ncbi:hypothetical protein PTTG_05943 [Puccinia triticina 1-1 BBBD Race 1]|uniref:CSP domain-containing protein n=1 Tax=Puccinia triticina (isolate 1-1 / race 1 (BBBD)) TaxID=630390 RepID=A0A180H520_PUCT1|nr:hypothetical protein PTTG_05943 [Puccinia triticina 1-1 BBBD Race 1]